MRRLAAWKVTEPAGLRAGLNFGQLFFQQLLVIQVTIVAVQGEEFVMRAGFHNSAFMQHGEQTGAGIREFSRPGHKPPRELGQAQRSIHFPSQFDQRFGPTPVLLREMQIARHFHHNRDLTGEHPGAPNVLQTARCSYRRGDP